MEARLQVELAQLEYSLPRLRQMWSHLGRAGGGIGTRGPQTGRPGAIGPVRTLLGGTTSPAALWHRPLTPLEGSLRARLRCSLQCVNGAQTSPPYSRRIRSARRAAAADCRPTAWPRKTWSGGWPASGPVPGRRAWPGWRGGGCGGTRRRQRLSWPSALPGECCAGWSRSSGSRRATRPWRCWRRAAARSTRWAGPSGPARYRPSARQPGQRPPPRPGRMVGRPGARQGQPHEEQQRGHQHGQPPRCWPCWPLWA
jgi:hypothetical protein